MRFLICCLHLLWILQQVSSCRTPRATLEFNGLCVLNEMYNARNESVAEYDAAKAMCATFDTTLPIILSEADNDGFVMIYANNYFIGLECDMTTNQYVWADGTPVGYINFADGRNSTFCNSTEHFIVDRFSKKKWRPFKQQAGYYDAIGYCVEPRLSTSNPCDDFDPLPGTDTCFSLVKANVTWDDAEMNCMEDSAHLISIHSKEQDEFLRSYALSRGVSMKFHIGLRAPVVPHHLTVNDFAWVDGSKKNYTNQLNDWSIFGHCAAMYIYQMNNNWLSDGCDDKTNLAAYMCSRPAFSSSPATPTTCPSNSTIFKEGDIITSPGFPNGYPPSKCTYNIRVAEGKKAQVEVLFFETTSIRYDVLTIHKADWLSTDLTGANIAGQLISAEECRDCTMNVMTMDWNAVSGVNVRGWKLRVNAVDPICGTDYNNCPQDAKHE